MNSQDPLFAPIPGAEHKDIGGALLDTVRAGDARVKRTIYGPGFQWETHMKRAVHTDLCMHAHVGFLARGHIKVEFPDGCAREFTAPAVVVLEPGHRGWVVGTESAVLIEVDFEGETARRFGLPEMHRHD
jgi:hypothetical protein